MLVVVVALVWPSLVATVCMLDLDVVKVIQQSSMLSCKLQALMLKGFSAVTDVMCQKIIHNSVAVRFFRMLDWPSYPPRAEHFTKKMPIERQLGVREGSDY